MNDIVSDLEGEGEVEGERGRRKGGGRRREDLYRSSNSTGDTKPMYQDIHHHLPLRMTIPPAKRLRKAGGSLF